jgi:16S rRNA (guanine(527)-N(7))-methyltransferase RsmG
MDTRVPYEVWFRTILHRNGVAIADHALLALSRYVKALLRANKSVNLISRRDEEEVWQRHILHSISVLFKLRFPTKCRVLDLGSGGGLPGIPIKIILPEIKLTLLDATRKKTAVVKKIIDELELKDIDVVWGRGEELSQREAGKERFDVVLARAVGPLADLVKLSYPLLKKGNAQRDSEAHGSPPHLLEEPCLVAYKGGDITAEVDKARRINCVRSSQTVGLVFNGSEQMELQDKKVVIVKFT